MPDRRRFLAALALSLAAGRAWAQDAPLAGQGDVGTLRDPWSAGRPRDRTGDLENDATIQAVERRLRCPCPCGLDVYTCRTTDFTCTYSPEAHREVLALYQQGRSPQEIIDAFVARYGERALMAPPPRGFNLAGYLVPGAVVLLLGAALVVVLRRRSAGAAGAAAAGVSAPVAAR
ncbi:MAG TPA: cytochrome c-type biogenesis protein CcmH, partial [Gemmatimonadales bacterium]|nr:cytochrome c-type biogenesis protein CcmH [Gemmatimonadales bacterium]